MKRTLLPLLFCLISPFVFANGYLAGGLSYSIDSKGSCTIKFNFLRDCNGCDVSTCPLSDLQLVAKNFSKSLTWSLDSTEEVTPNKNCLDCTRCTDPDCRMPYGFQMLYYSTKIDLSTEIKKGNCSFKSSLTVSSLSSLIQTGPTGDVYHEMTFNACVANSSPKANIQGEMICLSRDNVKNLFDLDIEHDSAYFLLDQIRKSATSVHAYDSIFSATKPITYLGFPKNYTSTDFPFGFHLDPHTGSIQYRPMKLEHSIYRIKRKEYRSGQLISESIQDIFNGVYKCPDNNPPVISGINCSKPIPDNFKTEVCAGEKVCFTICTSDKDRNDTIRITWNKGIPAGSFTILNKGDKRENAQFCWTPTMADAMATPPVYRFVVQAEDNQCGRPGFAARSFTIKVNVPASASVKATVLDSFGTVQFVANNTSKIEITQYLWKIEGNLIPKKGGNADTLIHRFKKPSIYPYCLTALAANGCSNFTICDTLQLYTVSVSELHEIGIDIYPNPAFNYLNIENNLGYENGAKLMSMDGKLIDEFQLSKGPNTIDLSKIPKGSYLLNMVIDGSLKSTQIIIK